jgi:hypothetical protein
MCIGSPQPSLLNLEAFSSQPTMLDDAVEPTGQLNPAAQHFEQFAEKHIKQILGAAVST